MTNQEKIDAIHALSAAIAANVNQMGYVVHDESKASNSKELILAANKKIIELAKGFK